jgi:hypothetical protein
MTMELGVGSVSRWVLLPEGAAGHEFAPVRVAVRDAEFALPVTVQPGDFALFKRYINR